MANFAGHVGSHPHTLLDDLQCRLHDVLGESASPETVLFTTSFSKEDQILTWAIVEARLDVDMVSLDTGCLFPATQQTWTETEAHFGRSIRRLVPNSATVEAFEAEGGMQSIYLSDVERKRCCGMRKLVPLKEAAAGKDWWITGLRGGHSENRSAMDMVEQAPEWGLRKFHPVLDWEEAWWMPPWLRPGFRSTPCTPWVTRASGVRRVAAGPAG